MQKLLRLLRLLLQKNQILLHLMIPIKDQILTLTLITELITLTKEYQALAILTKEAVTLIKELITSIKEYLALAILIKEHQAQAILIKAAQISTQDLVQIATTLIKIHLALARPQQLQAILMQTLELVQIPTATSTKEQTISIKESQATLILTLIPTLTNQNLIKKVIATNAQSRLSCVIVKETLKKTIGLEETVAVVGKQLLCVVALEI